MSDADTSIANLLQLPAPKPRVSAAEPPPGFYDDGPEPSEGGAPATAKTVKPSQVELDRARIVWADELDKDPGPLPWVSYGMKLAPGRPPIICGEGGSRKSMLAHYIAICCVRGERIFGRFDIQRGRALIIDFEQGLALTRKRSRRFANGGNFKLADYKDSLGYLRHPFDFDDMKIVTRLAELVKGFQLVIVDSVFRSASRLRQNDAEASVPLQIMTDASERSGAVFLGVDHASTKRDPDGRRKGMQSGNHHKFDGSGTLYTLTAEKGKPTLVTCEREQLEGEETPDFAFTVRDVVHPWDDEPPYYDEGEDKLESRAHIDWRKWGLSVEERDLDAAAADKPERPEKLSIEPLRQIAARILEEVKKCPGVTSGELEELVGIQTKRFVAAFKILKAEKKIVNRTGKATSTEWVAT